MSAAPDLPPPGHRNIRPLHALHLTGVLTLVILLTALRIAPEATAGHREADSAEKKAARGIEIVNHGGYPELRVDGAPFFIHSASFSYYRIPRDQWQPLLRIYRSEGINTIDLYIPWNWHEPKEGEFDFDGHSNPRRDLHAVLKLIAEEGFKLIARPGPEILNEWRHGGYPGWLLDRPEYQMNPVDWIEGGYPPLDGLNARDAEAAAQGWFQNATHMSHAREWLTTVAQVLAPYSANPVSLPAADQSSSAPQISSGSLLFVQLGDDFAIGRTNHVGPDFWRYVEALRSAVEAGGVDVPVFINPTDMRISASGSAQSHPIGVMGQWYLRETEAAGSASRYLSDSDADEIQFFTEELKTQPQFPPVMIEYQAGWYAPADDDHPVDNPPENTLLSSRLLIANGIHGLNYTPLQDTYSPAGYSVAWANHSYRWNAGLGPDGDSQPRILGVSRNVSMLRRWGPQLAASHKRADFGIVYPVGAYSQENLARADILQISGTVMRIERLATLSSLSTELLDPEYQPVEQLLRDALIFLPVLDPDRPQFQLSARAQRTLLDYVRRGGTLVVFPARPMGTVLEELWNSAPTAEPLTAEKGIREQWKFGEGEVIESTKDFFSWVPLDRSFAEIRAQRELDWARGVLHEFVAAANVHPAVILSGRHIKAGDLLASEIVTNEGTGLLGERTGGQGFLSLINLAQDAAETYIEILSPASSARGKRADYTAVRVAVPAHESLLLPLKAPICFADPANSGCGDAVETASAEFLDARREGKLLELEFYAPARADVRLRLERRPLHVMIDDNSLDTTWVPEAKELRVPLMRGAAPSYLRTLKIELPYKPNVPEAEKIGKAPLTEFDFSVWNSLRFPVSQGAFLRTYPPVLPFDPNRPTSIMFTIVNHSPNASRDLMATVDGPLRGSETYRIPPGSAEVEWIKLKPAGKDGAILSPGRDGFLHATIHIRSKDEQREVPVLFLPVPHEGVVHYRYDFDRDGADEWVLENSGLRLIVSPESGGQVAALVEKSSGENLSTSVGLLRDVFSYTENSEGISAQRARGRYGLSNRPYATQWQSEQTNPALKLQYDAPDIFPGGAHIEKTIQFESSGVIRADYLVRLNAPKSREEIARALPPQSFAVLNSFPAVAQADHATLFCWRPAGNDKENPHCEDFSPGGKTLVVPAEARRVEVHTAGHPATALEWDCASACPQLRIEPKNFSALLRLQFPALNAGGDAAQYTLRIRVLGAH